MRFYFWALYCTSLHVWPTTLLGLPQLFACFLFFSFTFVASFAIRKCKTLSFVHLQDCCHYSGSLEIPCGFLDRFVFLSKALGILIELALNLLIILGSIDISAIFLQSINRRCLSICAILSFFQQGFGISACKSSASLLKLCLSILSDIINGMVTFISFLDY